MQELVINGPTKWCGEVNIDGAKNACLPIMAALLMIDNQVTLNNIPKLNDIESMLKLLQCMGLDMTHQGNKLLSFRSRELNHVAPYELVKKMRASKNNAEPYRQHILGPNFQQHFLFQLKVHDNLDSR